MHNTFEICNNFKIDPDQILNVYCYGSRVYNTHQETSDYDYIVVHKGAFLESGAFRENAKSNHDRTMQIINFSRSGFKSGLENYEINCLECLYLPNDMVIQKKWPFKLEKINKKEFIDKIISKVSASWHSASLAIKDDNTEYARKGFYHAMRILDFAIQLKENNFTKIDFNTAKPIRDLIQFPKKTLDISLNMKCILKEIHNLKN